MKGKFEDNKKFCDMLKQDCHHNIDLILSNLRCFIQSDLENHQKQKNNYIDFYQAWEKAVNFDAFLNCLNSKDFIKNNLTTASWLYNHNVIHVSLDTFLNKENCKHFITYADRGSLLLTDKSNLNEMLLSNHYGDGETSIYIYENGEALLKDANPCVLHLSDVTISGVWNLKEYDCDCNSETLHVLKGAYFVYIEEKTVIFERYRTLEELQKE